MVHADISSRRAPTPALADLTEKWIGRRAKDSLAGQAKRRSLGWMGRKQTG